MQPSFERFYKTVEIAPDDPCGWRLTLDGKPAKSPRGRAIEIAHPRLADAIGQEWRGQAETVRPATMPMTRLMMSTLDHVVPRIRAVREEALRFGTTDLLCYRANEPERLVARQKEIWQPYLDWASEALNAPLRVSQGLAVVAQDEASLSALNAALTDLDAYRLLVGHGLTTRFGSLVLALSVVRGASEAGPAFEASRLDETFQAEIWGADAEAEARAEAIRQEVDDLARFLSLLD